jgi:hypothetical protein
MKNNRLNIVHGLRVVNIKQCSYSDSNTPNLASRCDCKYINQSEELEGLGGERTGCCELRMATFILEEMTDREYDLAVERASRRMNKRFKKKKA